MASVNLAGGVFITLTEVSTSDEYFVSLTEGVCVRERERKKERGLTFRLLRQ